MSGGQVPVPEGPIQKACVHEYMCFQQRFGGCLFFVLVEIRVNYAFKYAHVIF